MVFWFYFHIIGQPRGNYAPLTHQTVQSTFTKSSVMCWKHAGRCRMLLHFFWVFPNAQPNWRADTSMMNLSNAPPFWYLVGHSCTCQQTGDQDQLSKHICRGTSYVAKQLLLRRCFEHWMLPVVKEKWKNGSFSWMRCSLTVQFFMAANVTECRFSPCEVFSAFANSASQRG